MASVETDVSDCFWLAVNLISFNLPIHCLEKSRRNFSLTSKYISILYGQLAIYHERKFGRAIFLPFVITFSLYQHHLECNNRLICMNMRVKMLSFVMIAF